MDKPPIIRTTKTLPFGDLSPQEFERLCLWLVAREGYVKAEHLGETGNEQGRDIVTYKPTATGYQLWYFQCKRYQKISASVLIAEVNKYNRLAASAPAKKPFGIVFVTSATLSATAREQVSEYCATHGYESEFWARTELDEKVKEYPGLVKEFFSLPDEGGRYVQPRGTRPALPSDSALALVMDRDEQERKLEEAIREHCAKSPKSPLVCVVQGNIKEAPGAYIERLKQDSLSSFLTRCYPEKGEPPVLPFEMKLSLESVKDDNWEDVFWDDLGKAVRPDSKLSRGEIVNIISRRDAVVLIDAPLLSERFEGVAFKKLNHFFRFWDRWENDSEKLLLVVCLNLQYQSWHEARPWKYLLLKKGLNDELRGYVSKLERDSGAYENIHCVCLPELAPIRQTDAKEAINHPRVKQHCDIRELDVTRIYARCDLRTHEGKIPMGDLLDEFDETLRRRHYDR